MNQKTIRAVMSEMGRRSAAAMTPAQRVARARSASDARWGRMGPDDRRVATAPARAARAARTLATLSIVSKK